MMTSRRRTHLKRCVFRQPGGPDKVGFDEYVAGVPVYASLPTGFEAIQPGETYKRKLFTKDQLLALRQIWVMMNGKVLDTNYHTRLVQFVSRKEAVS